MSAYIPSIVIGLSSTTILIVLVCAVNLIVAEYRLHPMTEHDAAFVRWCFVFVVLAFLLNGAL
jgi:hypothetical protein